MTTNTDRDFLLDAIAESRRPEGVAAILQRLAHGDNPDINWGTRVILRESAVLVADMLAADDPFAALGRLTLEMYRHAPEHWGATFPIAMVAAITEMCTAEYTDDGILQHPGADCPVCDAKTEAGRA